MSIPKLVLDGRNEDELLEQAYQRVVAASGGVLNAKQPGSALMALLEGHTFLTAELLWYLNQLPEATAIEVMRLTGVERILSAKAFGVLKVTLVQPLGTPFILSVGTILGDYQTTSQLFIAPGQVEADVPVVALNAGSQGNAKAYQIRLGSVTNFVREVFNASDIVGGADIEPMDDYIDRIQRSLRRRDTLVSIEDYQQAAMELLGGENVVDVTAVPLLMGDKVSTSVGNVHCFAAYYDRSVPTAQALQGVTDNLKGRVFIGSSVFVSSAEYQDIQIDLVVKAEELSPELATAIFDVIDTYFNPAVYMMGETLAINEVEYRVRGVDKVKRVSTCYLNNDGLDIGMNTPYTYPTVGTLAVTLVDPLGNTNTYYRGTGTGDTD
jgi:uncharacterized phage protein gp47/JayE